MICYAIKYKNNGRYIIFKQENVFTPYDVNPSYSARDICDASFFDDYETALCYCPSDCKVVKVEIREKLECEHLLSEVEWQDYCSYKRIESQIKGCLDREKQLTERINEYESLMNKYNVEDLEHLDLMLFCLSSETKYRLAEIKEKHKKELQQSQNQTAIECLEKLRKKFEPLRLDFYLAGEVMNEIDKQIAELRGKEND